MADISEVLKVISPGARSTRSDDDTEPFVSFDDVVEPATPSPSIDAIGAGGMPIRVAVAGDTVSPLAGGSTIVLSVVTLSNYSALQKDDRAYSPAHETSRTSWSIAR